MAVRATRPRSAVISRRARPCAKFSRSCPPAYMSATTLPASGSPKPRAADIESAATMSRPTSPRRSEVTIWTNNPRRTGAVAMLQAMPAPPWLPDHHRAPPVARPRIATPARMVLDWLSLDFRVAGLFTVLSNRCRRGLAHQMGLSAERHCGLTLIKQGVLLPCHQTAVSRPMLRRPTGLEQAQGVPE